MSKKILLCSFLLIVNLQFLSGQGITDISYSTLLQAGISYNSDFYIGEFNFILSKKISKELDLEFSTGIFNRYWQSNDRRGDKSRFGWGLSTDLSRKVLDKWNVMVGLGFFSFSSDQFVPSLRFHSTHLIKNNKLRFMLSLDRSKDIYYSQISQIDLVPHKTYFTLTIGYQKYVYPFKKGRRK